MLGRVADGGKSPIAVTVVSLYDRAHLTDGRRDLHLKRGSHCHKEARGLPNWRSGLGQGKSG
eukprot:7533225-Lingulodinium_polyedra.AAC.1